MTIQCVLFVYSSTHTNSVYTSSKCEAYFKVNKKHIYEDMLYEDMLYFWYSSPDHVRVIDEASIADTSKYGQCSAILMYFLLLKELFKFYSCPLFRQYFTLDEAVYYNKMVVLTNYWRAPDRISFLWGPCLYIKVFQICGCFVLLFFVWTYDIGTLPAWLHDNLKDHF